MYPKEPQLSRANSDNSEASFLDLLLAVSNVFFSSKIYDKRDDVNLRIVNFPFLDGDSPRTIRYGVNISQLIHFARACSHVGGFNEQN